MAQYLNLELPLLEGVLQKLEEEEDREIQRVIDKSVTMALLHGHTHTYTHTHTHTPDKHTHTHTDRRRTHTVKLIYKPMCVTCASSVCHCVCVCPCACVFVCPRYHQQQRLLSQCLNTKLLPNIETSV